ncbi:hypothetical protein U1Q18_050084 [Sarracenia purpurea var. burkii]
METYDLDEQMFFLGYATLDLEEDDLDNGSGCTSPVPNQVLVCKGDEPNPVSQVSEVTFGAETEEAYLGEGFSNEAENEEGTCLESKEGSVISGSEKEAGDGFGGVVHGEDDVSGDAHPVETATEDGSNGQVKVIFDSVTVSKCNEAVVSKRGFNPASIEMQTCDHGGEPNHARRVFDKMASSAEPMVKQPIGPVLRSFEICSKAQLPAIEQGEDVVECWKEAILAGDCVKQGGGGGGV